jgi:hypothetical protein
MQTPDEVWLALTKTALCLINDLDAERMPRPPSEIADSALTSWGGVRGVEQYRARLEAFVRDILDEPSTMPT